MRLTRSLAGALATVTFLAAHAALAATWTYAGPDAGAAPCNTTLQACLTAADAGDTVEIATATPIDESLNITQSVTITSAAGVTGAIGTSSNQLTITDPTASVAVTLSNLDMTGSFITATFGTGTTDALTLQGSKVGGGVTVTWTVPLDLTVTQNQFNTTGEQGGLELEPSPASGTSTVQVIANEFESPNPPGSYDGVGIQLNGTGDLQVLVASNIFHDLAGCGCGGTGAIAIRPTTTGTSTIDVFDNTVDAIITDGPALQFYGPPTSGTLTLNAYNNIFTNAPNGFEIRGVGSNLTLNMDYNDVYQAPNYFVSGATYGSHNLAVDPEYVDEASRDYLLSAGSPALGAGTTATPDPLPAIDVTGEARVVSGHVDMGAYQSGQADLAAAIGSNPLSGAVGANFTLTAAISNNSPYDAPATVLTLKLPAGLIYSSYSAPQGTCSGVGTITCALGDLPAGGGLNVTVVATGETAGPQTVTASVASGVPDPNTANDSASITVTVGTTTPDAGTTPADAGQTADAGGTEDAGATHDAGVTEDAGSQPDAGVVADAGAQPDAGTVGDGGPGTEPRGGCGCGAGSSAAAVIWAPLLLLALSALRRRRRGA